MGASVVVCVPLRPPRPCHPEKNLKNAEEGCQKRLRGARAVHNVVCAVRAPFSKPVRGLKPPC